MKNKFNYLLGLLIVFILFILFFLVNLNKELNKEEDNIFLENINTGIVNEIPNEEIQEKIENLDENNNLDNFSGSILEIENKEENNQNQQKEDILIINEVSKNGEISLCENIINENLQSKCIDNGYALKSSLENSLDYCKKINDENLREYCIDNYYYDLALSSKNYKTCLNIDDEIIENDCMSLIILPLIEEFSYNGSIYICNYLEGENKDYCEKYLAGNGPQVVLDNSDNENLSKAITQKDEEICNLIVDFEKKTLCKETLSKIFNNEKLTQALNENNIELCYSISDENIRINCLDTINFREAINLQNESFCDNILDSGLKKQCVYYFKQININ